MKTRTRNLKRLLSLLLCLCLAAGLLPATVLAAGASDPAEDGFLWLTTDVVADNVAPTTGTKLYPGGATTEGAVYDQGTNTLTLTDFSGPTLNLIAREMGSGFKIVVNGTNALKCVRVYGGTYGGALTIEGTGTLTINNSADTAYYAGIDLRGEAVETALAIGAEVTLHVTGRDGSGAVSVAPAPTDSKPITWSGTLSNGQLASSPIILSLPAMYTEDPYDKYNVYQDGEGKYYGLKMGREAAPPFDFVYSVYEVTYADGTYTLGELIFGYENLSEAVKEAWLADKTPVWSDWSNWTISGDATMGGRLDTLSFLPGASQGPVITVTGSVPTEVKVGDPYNASLSATGSGTITWSQEGQWPDGIDLRDNGAGTAAISGSPTAAGSYTFSVKATDGSGQSATREFTLRVTNEVSQLSWTTARLAPSTVSLGAVNDYTLTLVPSEALTLPAGTVLSIRAQGVDFTDAAVSDSGFFVSNGGQGAVGIECGQETAIPAGGVTLTLTGVKNPGGESQIYPTLDALSWDADGVTYQLPETTMESIRYTGRVQLEGGVCYLIKGNQIYFSVTAYGDGNVTATLHYYTGNGTPNTKAYILERNTTSATAEGTVDFPADAARLDKTVFSLSGAESIEWTFDMNRNTATPQMEVTVHAAAGVPLDGACILIQETTGQKTGSMAYDPSSGQPFTMELSKDWAGRTVTVALAVYQGEYIKLAESGSLIISAATLNHVTLTVEETDYQSYTLRFQTADGKPVDASGLSGTLEWKGTSLGRRESYLFQNTLQAGDLTLKVSNPGEELARDYKMKETYTEGTGLAVDEGTITITLEKWDRSAGITGVVTCGEGDDSEPVAGMRVSAYQTLDGRSFQSVAVSGADGSYTIPSLVPGVEAKITAAAVGYPDYEDTVSKENLTENGTYIHDITLSGTQGTIFVSLSQLPIPGTAANGSTVQSPTFSVWQPVLVTEGEDGQEVEPDETKHDNTPIEVTQVATTGGYYLTLPGGDWGGKEVDVTVTAPALAQAGSVVSQGRGGVIRVQLDQRGYGRASFNGLVQMGVVNLGTPTSRDLYYVFVYDSEGELTSVLSPTVSMPTQVTPLYASELPDTAADLTAEEAVLAGVQAAEGQEALEALLDAYQAGLTPETASRQDLLRAYAGLYENVAVAGDPDAADADIVLSDTAPDAAGDYEMTFTTQTGMVTGTQAGALVQSLANNPNYQKSAVNGNLNVGGTTYNSVTNYTRLFFCDKAGRLITDPETIAAGTFAGTVSLTFTVGASSGGTEVCWTRITTLTPGAKFPSYADTGALSGFEPAAAVIRNAGGETLLLRNTSLGVGGTTVLSAGTGETTTTTTTETRRLNQEEMQVYFDSGVAGSDISYETYANFVMDLVPLSDDTKFMGQTFDYFKNTKALFGEATECEQLGTIADVLEGYRKNLLEIYDTFSGLPTDQCKDLAKLARMSLDALGEVSEIVDQAQVTHLAVSRITDEMSKVGILVGPLEFTGAGTLYNVSTAFVGLAANATNDQTKAEAQRQFIGFSYLYEQVYSRATAMGYKQGSGGDAGNIEEVTTVTKTVTTNRQRHYTWVENGKLWALVKVIETTTETTTVELRITYYTGVYRTIPISSDTVETQRYWEEKEVVDDPGSDGWSSDTTTEVTENGESVPPSGGSGVEIKHDPSGYVYEAVLSNPVAGATVTLYQNTADFEPEYNGGDVGKPDYSTVINTDDIPATNARRPYVDYTDAPQINPMTSDQEGHYGWDVPQGLWYVEAEAAGYQTGSSNSDRAAIVSITDSSGTVNWLPVLPPQLDVNIPMVDDSVPTVTSVTPQTDGVYIQFSKYMEEDSLTADSFKLWVDGQTVSFAVDKVDSEQAPDNIDYGGTAVPSYTSLVRLIPETSLTEGQQVKVAVNAGNKNLSSYAGTDFPNTYVSGTAPVVQQASVAAPSASIPGGTYYGPQQVTLSCNTPGAEIWYTTGGGAFDRDTWTRYTGSIPVSSSVTLRFIAVKAGMLDSAIQAITLQIETPVISGGGTTPGGDDTPGTDPGGTTPGGGGGGGGGGGSSGYSISVPSSSSIKGGSITVSPRSADKGDTVTITVKPDDGYELNTLTVTDAKGNELEVTDKGGGKYTFSMPGSSVKIQVSFKAIAEQVANPFTDVAAGAYYEAAVLWAVANGVTNGTTATTFSPNVTVTRAHMVTFLWRAHGAPKAAGSNPFTDVSSSAYYYDAVLWAVEHGVTNGTTATTFGPNAPVTRAQAVTFQWRASGSPAVSGGSFSDVAADAYYSGAVAWAVANGITNGTAATTFSPDTPVSRAQAVTFLWRELA